MIDICSVSGMLHEQYGSFYKTLAEISSDTSLGTEVVPLCKSNRCCYCYDDIIKNDFEGQEYLSSMDAISVCGEYVNFIEFKNGKIEHNNIRHKITEGMYYFERYVLKGNFLAANNIKTRFILVYNINTCKKGKYKSRECLNTALVKLSGNGTFDRKRFLKARLSKVWSFFDEAISLPVEVFEKEIDKYV